MAMKKNDAVILVALVRYTKFGVNKPKQTEFLFLVTVTLTLITYTWVTIPSCVLM